ncbi:MULTISPECIES: hypothetical protein [Kordiimonas]|jgi:nitric oxide reductase large subunit|uniref:hypothetical protein n=1 Tax=Kordiimonas TaxID=288021 RepID=UPI00257F4852|nr:hypothetical protein [Kordiimonas sp. UBA4487]
MSDHPTSAPQAADSTKVAKYRAWLSVVSLLVAALFGTLAMGSFAAGEGLAGDAAPDDFARIIITFNILGIVLFGFTAATLYLAWRFRPGGD